MQAHLIDWWWTKLLALTCAHVFCLGKDVHGGGIRVAYHGQAAGESYVFFLARRQETSRLNPPT